ncbi:hypothetical protein, partial [Zoogloea sp.]|uniref:hypothetical protein n=1 Tax=Zoogloea sp. TaxID=49181 RepID=UPI001AC20F07
PAGSPLFASRGTPVDRAAGERRPRWESLPATTTPAAAAHAGHANHSTCSCGGCGCRRCCGG